MVILYIRDACIITSSAVYKDIERTASIPLVFIALGLFESVNVKVARRA